MTVDRLKEIGIVYVAYLVLGYGGIYLTYSSGGSLALLWLGSGVSLSALIIFGRQIWPAIWLGSFSAVAPLMMRSDALEHWWQFALLVPIPPTINVLVQSFFAYYLYQKLVGRQGFASTKKVVSFVFIVITVPTVFNSLLLASFYSLTGIMAQTSLVSFLKSWLAAGLGDIHGYFILTPVAIAWLAMGSAKTGILKEKLLPLVTLTSAFISLLVLSLYFPGPVIFLLVPLAVLVSLNFGLRGTSLYIFFMSFTLTVATANGLGPFIEATTTDSFISLLIFVFSMGIPLLILASERYQLQLHQASLEETVAMRTRELSHAVAAKDEFLATISHELRTPLHAILGVARLLDRKSLSDHLASRINLVESAGESLLSQINSILTFIRFSNDTEELPTSEFELHQLVHITAALMEEAAQEVGSSIVTTIDETVPTQVVGVPEQLRQVLFNLLSNAVKYGIGSPIHLRVTGHKSPLTNLVDVNFCVEDEGPGIPLEDQSRIFEKFTRINPDQTSVNGTGLGLAISKRLVEKMGGVIEVESNGFKGTKIVFSLQFDLPLEKLQTQVTDGKLETEKYCIVLLEDDPIAMAVSSDFLVLRGHEVLQATTAHQALEILQSQPVDALLSDINLPDMSGLDLVRQLRLRQLDYNTYHNNAYHQIYIAALTASVLPAQERTFLDAGFRSVLSKPLDQQQLDRFFTALSSFKKTKGEFPILNHLFVEEELSSIGEAAYGSVIEAFISTYEIRLEALEKAIERGDVQSQIQALHLLGSGASNMGMIRFQGWCRDLERRLEAGESLAIDVSMLQKIKQESFDSLLEMI